MCFSVNMVLQNPPKSDLEIAFYSPDGDYQFYGGSVDSQYAYLLEAFDKGVTVTDVLDSVSTLGSPEFVDQPVQDYVNHDLAIDASLARTGTFQPLAKNVQLTVRASVGNTGLANANVILMYGQPAVPGSNLFSNNLGAAAAGTTRHVVGVIGSEQAGTVTGTFKLTNLDKTKRVTYQVMIWIIGGSQVLPVGTTPRTLAITPDGKRLFVGNAGSDNVSVYTVGGNPFWSKTNGQKPQDELLTTTAAGAFPFDSAANNVHYVVCNLNGNSVTCLNAVTGAAIFTTATPGLVSPLCVAIENGGAQAWVGCTDGKVYPISLPGGVFGAGLAVGAAGNFISGIAMNPNSGGFYCCNQSTGMARGVTLPGLVILAESNVGGAPVKLRMNDTTKYWVVCQTTNRMKSVSTATGLVVDDFALPHPVVRDFSIVPPSAGQPTRTAFVGFDAGKWIQIQLSGPFAGQAPYGNQFDTPSLGNISSVVAGPFGDTWYTEAALNRVRKFPAGEMSLHSLPFGFFGTEIVVKAVPAKV